MGSSCSAPALRSREVRMTVPLGRVNARIQGGTPMKRALVAAVASAMPAPSMIVAQPPMQPASAQKSLAATMNVYVFPSKGQSTAQQNEDESTCYNWAVGQTGTDPFSLQQQAQQQQQQAQQAQ